MTKPDVRQLCEKLAASRDSCEDWDEFISHLVFHDNEILALWQNERNDAANSGTWMHSMLEHLMNGFQVQPGVMSQEMLSAVNFLAQHPGCKVFRTA